MFEDKYKVFKLIFPFLLRALIVCLNFLSLKKIKAIEQKVLKMEMVLYTDIVPFCAFFLGMFFSL